MGTPMKQIIVVLVLGIAGCGGGTQRAETPSPASTDRSADDMGLASEGGIGSGMAVSVAPLLTPW